MTSLVKLPPLPSAVDTVRALFRGQPDYFEAQDSYYTQDQMRAYAEQAVREALEVAAQALGDMSQKEFERPGFSWPTHMAYHQAMQTIRSLTPSGGSGHKPAPMDISSGHNALIPEKDHGEPS